MPYGARLDSLPITPPRRSRLAIRIIARDGHATVLRRTLLPVIGADDIILPAFDDTLGSFAIRAQQGDTDARDALFFAYLPKLERLMSVVRTPAVSAGSTSTWDRDDVEQEAYLVFVDLVNSWCGDVSFTSWLLARFPWRLRNTVRGGIAKPSTPPRQWVVPIEDAALEPIEMENVDPDEQRMVGTLMDALPDHLAQVLVAHAFHGTSKSQIARDLGLGRRTIVRYWQQIRNCAEEVLGLPPEPASRPSGSPVRQAEPDSSQ
jgi:RNA polymerase sigma factor (sigma-70 family)